MRSGIEENIVYGVHHSGFIKNVLCLLRYEDDHREKVYVGVFEDVKKEVSRGDGFEVTGGGLGNAITTRVVKGSSYD